ncbi:MAG: S4 domain-containing protein [Pseudomonadota bacterium]
MSVEDKAPRVRLDRWLWAARFFKTRSLAKSAIENGKVLVDGQRGKPAKEIGVGTALEVRRNEERFVVEVTGLAERRGSATVAATLYSETEDSINRRAAERANRQMLRAGLKVPERRPDKHSRRALKALKQADDHDG